MQWQVQGNLWLCGHISCKKLGRTSFGGDSNEKESCSNSDSLIIANRESTEWLKLPLKLSVVDVVYILEKKTNVETQKGRCIFLFNKFIETTAFWFPCPGHSFTMSRECFILKDLIWKADKASHFSFTFSPFFSFSFFRLRHLHSFLELLLFSSFCFKTSSQMHLKNEESKNRRIKSKDNMRNACFLHLILIRNRNPSSFLSYLVNEEAAKMMSQKESQ